MDPIIGSSLISAGGSLLGGLFGGKSENTWTATRDGIFAQAHAARKAGEKFGFNPLTLLGASSAIPGGSGGSSNYMGAAIADAAAIAADGLLRNSAAQKLERAERLNAKLSQDLTNATLRPKIPGVYAARGSVAAASGGGYGSSGPVLESSRPSAVTGGGDSGGDPGLRPLPPTDIVDPRRPIEDAPVKSHSGFLKIDNPWFGEWWVPTLDGEEPIQWYDLPTLGVVGATSAGVRIGRGARSTYGELAANRAALKALDEKNKPKKSKTYIPSDYSGKYPAGKRGPQRGAY